MATEPAFRSFIAIEIDPRIKPYIAELGQRLSKIGVKASWTKPDNAHLTLKFLGDISQPQIDKINQMLSEVSVQAVPFELTTDRLGCFPSPDRPRVIWIGLKPHPSLLTLFQILESKLAVLSLSELDTKSFHGHITVGRIKEVANRRALIEFLKGSLVPEITWRVEQIIFFKSELTPQGPIYTRIQTASLTGRS